ncbi:MAG: endonuclease [Candidatus Marinimicrobia bacterium]|nr:endonuclease [Candidatus Neomarinimicrobiota bacterium]
MSISNNRYSQLIDYIFHKYYKKGKKEILFERSDFKITAKKLRIELPKNLGDIIYSFRYRANLPEKIQKKAKKDYEWVIVPKGQSKYAFVQRKLSKIIPNLMMSIIKIPDATPGIVMKYSLEDEQALLVKLRYNRLIDIFTGITCYSLQNHLRTTVHEMGQVETDEIYVGIDRKGAQYVLPIQAKSGSDQMGIVQIEQDIAVCKDKFPNLICRPIGAQFIKDGQIALFEFEESNKVVSILVEKHYKLVPPNDLSEEELIKYRESLN